MKKSKKFRVFSISIIIAATTMVAGVKAFEYQNEYKSDSLESEVVDSETTNNLVVESDNNNLNEEIVQENTNVNEEEIPTEINEEEVVEKDISNEINENPVKTENTDESLEEISVDKVDNLDESEFKEEETLIKNEEEIVEPEKLMPLSLPTTPTNVNSLSGEFSLQTYKPIDFGTHKIERKKKIVTTGFEGDFSVVDARGTQDGWEVKVSATPFTIVEPEGGWIEYNPYQLPIGSLTLSSLTNVFGYNYSFPEMLMGPTSDSSQEGDIVEPQGMTLVNASQDITPSINVMNTAIDMGEFVTVATAGPGQGMGEYILQYDMSSLSLVIDPITAKVDKTNYPEGVTPYESTITWNLISGPSSGIVPNSYNPYSVPTSLIQETPIEEEKGEDLIVEEKDEGLTDENIKVEEPVQTDETTTPDEMTKNNNEIETEDNKDTPLSEKEETPINEEVKEENVSNEKASDIENTSPNGKEEEPISEITKPDVIIPKEKEVISSE